MKGFQGFIYEGKPISDFRQWARDRKEMLVHYEKITKQIDPLTGKISTTIEEGLMPQTFWNTIKYGCNDMGVTMIFKFLGEVVP